MKIDNRQYEFRCLQEAYQRKLFNRYKSVDSFQEKRVKVRKAVAFGLLAKSNASRGNDFKISSIVNLKKASPSIKIVSVNFVKESVTKIEREQAERNEKRSNKKSKDVKFIFSCGSSKLDGLKSAYLAAARRDDGSILIDGVKDSESTCGDTSERAKNSNDFGWMDSDEFGWISRILTGPTL